MSSAPWLESDVSLKALNTFGLPATARRLVRIRGDADVRRVLDSPEVGRAAKLVLGGGSNLVLTRDVDEVVLKVEVGGLRLVETRDDAFIVEAGAGLGWHDVVTETVERGWPGLENLALIPGTVGDLSWGGAASTAFWIDPKEELIAILMTQLLPSSAYPIRRELRTLVYSAFTESYA